jgi:hypothetical protein
VKIGVTYELPFGKGKQFAGGGGPLNWVAGGWTVSYIGNYMSGVPLGFGAPGASGWNNWVNRANIVNPNGASLHSDFSASSFDMSTVNQPNPNHMYVNTQYIKEPGRFELGNSANAISQLRAFPNYNEDFGVQKNFSIKERFKVQLRAEMMNVLNRHRFPDPWDGGIDTSPSSPTFGQVVKVSDDHREAQLGLRLDF